MAKSEKCNKTGSVTLTQKEIQSWDRGYNAIGVQVSGSKSGPYIFIKPSR